MPAPRRGARAAPRSDPAVLQEFPRPITVRRRGVTYPRISAAGISAASSLSRTSPVSSSIARRCIPAGISSENSSSSSSPPTLRGMEEQGSVIRPGQPRLAACLGERPDPQDVGGAFGHADHAAGVEQIEQVARLQALVIGRQRQAVVDEPAAFLLGIGEMSDETGGVGELEIVGRELTFGAPEDLAVGDAAGSGGRYSRDRRRSRRPAHTSPAARARRSARSRPGRIRSRRPAGNR